MGPGSVDYGRAALARRKTPPPSLRCIPGTEKALLVGKGSTSPNYFNCPSLSCLRSFITETLLPFNTELLLSLQALVQFLGTGLTLLIPLIVLLGGGSPDSKVLQFSVCLGAPFSR